MMILETNPAELARVEEQISKRKAIDLYDKGVLISLEAGTYCAHRAPWSLSLLPSDKLLALDY